MTNLQHIQPVLLLLEDHHQVPSNMQHIQLLIKEIILHQIIALVTLLHPLQLGVMGHHHPQQVVLQVMVLLRLQLAEEEVMNNMGQGEA